MTSLVDLQTWKRFKSDNGDVTSSLLTVVLSLRPSYKLCGAIKYLGIDVAAAKIFTCSYDNAKRKFYRAFNAILGKIGRRRTASEEVIIQLLKSKCLPVWSRCMPSTVVLEKKIQRGISLSLNSV